MQTYNLKIIFYFLFYVLSINLVRSDWTAIASYKKTPDYVRNRRRAPNNDELCENSGLSITQQEICKTNPTEIMFLSSAVDLGIKLCESMLKNSMWNCPNKPTNEAIKFLGKKNSKELGFSHALLSAAGMAQIHDACKRGDIQQCQCEIMRSGYRSQNYDSDRQNQLEICSMDAAVNYGYEFSKGFIDVEQYERQDYDMVDASELSKRRRDVNAKKRERRAAEEKLLKLYNAEVGRMIAKQSSALDCKCFGVSGSCSQKKCTEKIARFGTIAADIYRAYKRSKRVKLYKGKLVDRRDRNRVFIDNETGYMNLLDVPNTTPRILYTRRKQDFCGLDSKGNYLNVNRPCEIDNSLANACNRICCGYGHKTETEVLVEKYNCQFNWSAGAGSSGSIDCDEKRTEVVKHMCKSPNGL